MPPWYGSLTRLARILLDRVNGPLPNEVIHVGFTRIRVVVARYIGPPTAPPLLPGHHVAGTGCFAHRVNAQFPSRGLSPVTSMSP